MTIRKERETHSPKVASRARHVTDGRAADPGRRCFVGTPVLDALTAGGASLTSLVDPVVHAGTWAAGYDKPENDEVKIVSSYSPTASARRNFPISVFLFRNPEPDFDRGIRRHALCPVWRCCSTESLMP